MTYLRYNKTGKFPIFFEIGETIYGKTPYSIQLWHRRSAWESHCVLNLNFRNYEKLEEKEKYESRKDKTKPWNFKTSD